MTARDITFTGLFIALALVIPVLFHAVGLGSAFLPMFLPILLAGLLTTGKIAGLAGFFAPLLSAVLTGMPPLAPPIAPLMSIEGLLLGIMSAHFYRRQNWPIFIAAGIAVCIQRIVAVALTAVFAPYFGLPGPLAALGMLIRGLPGIGLLIIFVPLLVRRLEPVVEFHHASR